MANSPSWTKNAAGNLVATGTVLTAGTTSSAVALDLTTKVLGQVQVPWTFSNNAPSSPSGLQVNIYLATTSGPTADNQPYRQFIIPATQNATNPESIRLESGQYSITVKNLDSTNQGTYGISYDTMDSD